jgi:hypothetical protein
VAGKILTAGGMTADFILFIIQNAGVNLHLVKTKNYSQSKKTTSKIFKN